MLPIVGSETDTSFLSLSWRAGPRYLSQIFSDQLHQYQNKIRDWCSSDFYDVFWRMYLKYTNLPPLRNLFESLQSFRETRKHLKRSPMIAEPKLITENLILGSKIKYILLHNPFQCRVYILKKPISAEFRRPRDQGCLSDSRLPAMENAPERWLRTRSKNLPPFSRRWSVVRVMMERT